MMENRYDRYKDSGIAWIGEIPEHWEIIKIKNAFNIISGATPKTDNMAYWDGEITWITPADYNTEDKIISSGKRNITLAGLNSCGASIVPEGSIIFSKRAPIGLVAINVVPLCTNQGCISCIPKPSVNTKYFYYLMSVLTEWFELFGSGTTFKELSTNNFANFILSQPLILEQQSIAAYLDQKCGEIDELITLQEEMITKLQSYKQSVITEAVTKGLDKNAPLKDSGIEWIGKIPEHWICTVFKRFLLEPMQYGANEPAEECNYYDPRYIRITDIKDDGTLRDDTFKSLPLGKAKEYMLTKGDLLFARSGATVGKTFLYKEDYAACFAGYLIKARCNKNKLVPNFVFYYTLSNVYQNWKNSIFIQSTIQNIGADKYSVMPIIVPPLSEQQAIADYLNQRCSEIDELISIKQQKIEKLKEYKKSLIFECVTGKRKVS